MKSGSKGSIISLKFQSDVYLLMCNDEIEPMLTGNKNVFNRKGYEA